MIVACIVEGEGEVAGLPLMLRRLTTEIDPNKYIEIPEPLRVRRDRFLNRDEEFSRFVQLAAFQAQADGRVLILLDADDDCPVTLSERIRDMARGVVDLTRLIVVIANREFEAWFIACADQLNGSRGIRFAGPLPPNPDSIRGAKEWLTNHIPDGRYRERTDQPALCSLMDFTVARGRSRSFQKLASEWERVVAAA